MSNTSSLPRRRVRVMAVQYRMQACSNFDEFAEQWRPTYPAMISSWENAWHEFVPFLDFPPELRAAFRRRQPWSSAQSGKSLRTL